MYNVWRHFRTSTKQHSTIFWEKGKILSPTTLIKIDRQPCSSTARSLLKSGENEFFHRVMASLPTDCSLGLAYGSGVFPQAGKSWQPGTSMTDFILAVNQPQAWHTENLALNPHHYPWMMRQLGPKVIASLQTSFGAKIYFNTLIPFEEGKIKYGVISTADLIADLTKWETLYVAGRLHKPVNMIKVDHNQDHLLKALKDNLRSAVLTAFIMLPETFSMKELFLAIAGFSYTGDLRMVVGEDKNKVTNIVEGQMDFLRELYTPILKSESKYAHNQEDMITQDLSPEAVLRHLILLPSNLQHHLCLQVNKAVKSNLNNEDALVHLSRESMDKIKRELQLSLGNIVRGSSSSQALKGIISAGPVKATQYSQAKLVKMIKSMR